MDMTNMRMDAGLATAVLPPVAHGLTPLDWRVVALARAEADRHGTAAFRPRTRLGRMMDWLTGVEGGVRQLADERLETLRRYVGLARRGDRDAATAAAMLATLGLAPAAIELVRTFATR
ncbi:hypothetical protein [Sphingomonas jatrophae]|uniref:Uncharacterized protein n=1 Tax=Sphingomonas jatrophae TaxID=1166337 RepID=A0A1I6M8E6_9SPHN|nr:hypothetical protein [Sphingomonas jatrophae]SFS11959.1 hypothetical protein SAMN05192580_3660 [Sphingomonas jatrophae]